MRRFVTALLVPLFLVAAGTVGYHLIEGWSLFDALYMTITTLTTVGFQEVHPLSTAGRAFTLGLLVTGVFTVFYAATAVIHAMFSGELAGYMGRHRMERDLAALSGHAIVCGYGRMGRRVCAEFEAMKRSYVLIDREAATLEGFKARHGIPLHGDATDDDILRRAGVERAKNLVTVAARDADNLFITMSARLMNEHLFIVARAEDEDAEAKLLRAGANRVVSPYVIGGHRVAQAVLRPNVVDFLELATRHDFVELQIEETEIGERSALAGVLLRDTRIREELGIIIVAIKKADGQMVFNPGSDAAIAAGDMLITLGRP